MLEIWFLVLVRLKVRIRGWWWRSWVMLYIYESPHKERSLKIVCVCLRHIWIREGSFSLAMEFLKTQEKKTFNMSLSRILSLKCRAEASRGHHLSPVRLSSPAASPPPPTPPPPTTPPLEFLLHVAAAVLSLMEDYFARNETLTMWACAWLFVL